MAGKSYLRPSHCVIIATKCDPTEALHGITKTVRRHLMSVCGLLCIYGTSVRVLYGAAKAESSHGPTIE